MIFRCSSLKGREVFLERFEFFGQFMVLRPFSCCADGDPPRFVTYYRAQDTLARGNQSGMLDHNAVEPGCRPRIISPATTGISRMSGSAWLFERHDAVVEHFFSFARRYRLSASVTPDDGARGPRLSFLEVGLTRSRRSCSTRAATQSRRLFSGRGLVQAAKRCM
jgi:hypothetical protein